VVGFDNFIINHQLLLALPFREMIGGVGAAANGELVYGREKAHHLGTLDINGTGAMNWGAVASGFPYLEFVPTLGVAADWTWVESSIATTADLDFTSEDFTLLAWIYLANLGAVHTIMCRGAQAVANGGGYQMTAAFSTPSRVGFATCQGVDVQTVTSEAEINAATWHLVGVTRSGVVGKSYIDGQDRTTSAEDLVAPATQNEPFHIGVRQIETTGVGIGYDTPFEGYLAYPRVWGSRCLSDEIMLAIWNHERGWFNV